MRKSGFILTSFLMLEATAAAQNFQIFNFGENEISRFNAAAIMDEGSMVYFRGCYNWYNNSDLYQEKPYDLEAGGNAVGKWGGISAQISYDEYSFFKRHNLSVNYAYQWRTGICNQHHFSISGGISLGLDHFNQYTGEDISTITGCSPDLNLGFEYSNKKLRVGIGGRNLIRTKYYLDGYGITRNPRVLLIYFRYRWDVGGVVGISPMIFAGYSEKTLVEIDLKLDYKKIVALSYGFRAMDLRHILVLNLNIPGTPITFDMGYAFAQFYHAHELSAGISVKL